MSEIGLGRKAPPDRSGDMNYLLPRPRGSLLAGIDSRLWYSSGVLDQEATSQCVAFSGFKYLTTGPVMNRHPHQTPAEIYGECLKNDEWEGEDWDGGTSVRALFKVLKNWGYISEYRWAFDVETVVGHLLTKGPVVVGTNWYHDMFMPHDRTGYMSVTGPVVGGHAWLLIGAYKNKYNPDKTRGAIRMINSWGKGWGQYGRAWITFGDMNRLIKEDGEACVATELRISALEQNDATA